MIKKLIDNIGYIAVGLGILAITVYLTIQLFTSGNDEVEYLESQIESKEVTIGELEKSNNDLKKDIVKYEQQIEKVNREIDSIKQKLNNYKDVTNEKINNIELYSINELQSFFSERYPTDK